VTILLNYHIGRIVLGSMCVGDSVWMVWRITGTEYISERKRSLCIRE